MVGAIGLEPMNPRREGGLQPPAIATMRHALKSTLNEKQQKPFSYQNIKSR